MPEIKTYVEHIQVTGDNLLAKVRELIGEGNVRRVILKNEDGTTLVEIPLTAGVAATVITVMIAPVLAAVGAIAALVSNLTIVVERTETIEDGAADQTTVEVVAPDQAITEATATDA